MKTFIAYTVNEGGHLFASLDGRSQILISSGNRIQRRRAQSVASFRRIHQGEVRPRVVANSFGAAFQYNGQSNIISPRAARAFLHCVRRREPGLAPLTRSKAETAWQSGKPAPAARRSGNAPDRR